MPLGEFLLGKPAEAEQVARFTPEQQQALSQILSFALPRATKGQAFDFGPIEQQARTGFAQKTIPSIAERFTAMGAGAQRTSAFPQILGAAGAGLEEALAAQKQQFGLQQQGLLQNLLGLGLGQRFDTMYRPETTGLLGGLAQTGAQGAGAFLPLLLRGLL